MASVTIAPRNVKAHKPTLPSNTDKPLAGRVTVRMVAPIGRTRTDREARRALVFGNLRPAR